jgi:hypothetical protein
MRTAPELCNHHYRMAGTNGSMMERVTGTEFPLTMWRHGDLVHNVGAWGWWMTQVVLGAFAPITEGKMQKERVLLGSSFIFLVYHRHLIGKQILPFVMPSANGHFEHLEDIS